MAKSNCSFTNNNDAGRGGGGGEEAEVHNKNHTHHHIHSNTLRNENTPVVNTTAGKEEGRSSFEYPVKDDNSKWNKDKTTSSNNKNNNSDNNNNNNNSYRSSSDRSSTSRSSSSSTGRGSSHQRSKNNSSSTRSSSRRSSSSSTSSSSSSSSSENSTNSGIDIDKGNHHQHYHHEQQHQHEQNEESSTTKRRDSSKIKESPCYYADKCVSACAAYGRVCPCAARLASKAVTEKIIKLFSHSNLVSSKPNFTKIPPKHVLLGNKLGEGGYCLVHSCTINIPLSEDNDNNNNDNNKLLFKELYPNMIPSKSYAIKFLKRNVMVNRRAFRHGSADLAIEAYYLSSLSHPNIVTLYGITNGTIEDNVASGRDHGFYIIIDQLTETIEQKIYKYKIQHDEYIQYLKHKKKNTIMSLFTSITSCKEYKDMQYKLLIERLHLIAIQIVNAMIYLHSLNIVYRDLKPDNIGVTENGILKLFDFGLAKELKETERNNECGKYNMTGCTGSRRYMAPEVAKDEKYDKSVDVYSFGILLWELCSLEKPFNGYTSQKHMNLVVIHGERPKIESHWPIQLQTLIQQCWSSNSIERPTFEQIHTSLEQIIIEGRKGITAEAETSMPMSTTITTTTTTTTQQTTTSTTTSNNPWIFKLSRRCNKNINCPI